MKKGFTMIELIFVIVILGILAAVAIPKLAATRNDAKAAAIKTDIGTAMQAVPAWFQGQKEVAFKNAMSIDTNVWKQSGSSCKYVYTDDAGDTITMEVDKNATSGALSTCPDSNATDYGKAPFLRIDFNATNGGSIVGVLANDMNMSDTNVTLGGKKVKW
jgi:general secretion pathway protein G